jgi:hypothetical protein
MTFEVGIGTAIVAYIDPHAGYERAFNRWYERDHLYAATMAGPGAFAGARWVATRACKDVRPSNELLGDPRRGSYLATCWVLPGMQAAWDGWVTEQMTTLAAEGGRLFPEREHIHTAVYRYGWDHGVDGLRAAVALDRCFDGVVAVAFEAGAADRAEEWTRAIVGVDAPVAVGLVRERVIMATASAEPHVLVVAFCARDPLAVWKEQIAPALVDAPIGFASPFLRTIPGTDTYVDAL